MSRNPVAKPETKQTKRQRNVYPSDELPHLWAHQTQSSARNGQGNFYFYGPTIYSYGSHFPIATIAKNRKKEPAFLLTTRAYSNTTSKHISAVRSAIPHDARVFHVSLRDRNIPDLSTAAHGYNLDSYRSVIADLLTRAENAKGLKWEHYANAHRKRAEMQSYVKFFGLPALSEKARISSRKLPVIPVSLHVAVENAVAYDAKIAQRRTDLREKQRAQQVADEQAWITAHPEYRERYESGTPFWELTGDQYQKDRALADAEREKKALENVESWRNGESVEVWGLPRSHPTMLRVKGDQVETSMGARFPVDHAQRGLTLVRSVVARGEEWKANGHTCPLGHYRIERIGADGTVYAGCHVVTWPEIERIVPALEAA